MVAAQTTLPDTRPTTLPTWILSEPGITVQGQSKALCFKPDAFQGVLTFREECYRLYDTGIAQGKLLAIKQAQYSTSQSMLNIEEQKSKMFEESNIRVMGELVKCQEKCKSCTPVWPWVLSTGVVSAILIAIFVLAVDKKL